MEEGWTIRPITPPTPPEPAKDFFIQDAGGDIISGKVIVIFCLIAKMFLGQDGCCSMDVEWGH